MAVSTGVQHGRKLLDAKATAGTVATSNTSKHATEQLHEVDQLDMRLDTACRVFCAQHTLSCFQSCAQAIRHAPRPK